MNNAIYNILVKKKVINKYHTNLNELSREV